MTQNQFEIYMESTQNANHPPPPFILFPFPFHLYSLYIYIYIYIYWKATQGRDNQHGKHLHWRAGAQNASDKDLSRARQKQQLLLPLKGQWKELLHQRLPNFTPQCVDDTGTHHFRFSCLLGIYIFVVQ